MFWEQPFCLGLFGGFKAIVLTPGEFHPIEVPACAEGQSLPRYEVSHAWFLIVYMLSLFLVDFLPTLLSQPLTPSCRDVRRWMSYCPWCASCWQVCPSILVLSATTYVSYTVFFLLFTNLAAPCPRNLFLQPKWLPAVWGIKIYIWSCSRQELALWVIFS